MARVVFRLFTATWCGPCVPTKAALRRQLEPYSDEVTLEIVDVDHTPDPGAVAGKEPVRSLPTVHVIVDGKLFHAVTGAPMISKHGFVDETMEAVDRRYGEIQ